MQLRLQAVDPESRPFVISLMVGSPLQAKVTEMGVLLWKPKTNNSEKFYLKATDECNASSTFEMTIEIVACPCTDKGTCRPDRNHPRGSGMYVCECQPGYEGQMCEKEINECLSSPCIHGEFETRWLFLSYVHAFFAKGCGMKCGLNRLPDRD